MKEEGWCEEEVMEVIFGDERVKEMKRKRDRV